MSDNPSVASEEEATEALEDRLEREKEVREECYVDGDVLVVHDEYYTIRLSDLDTPEKVLGWIHHLVEKTWMDKILLRRFINCAAGANDIEIEGP